MKQYRYNITLHCVATSRNTERLSGAAAKAAKRVAKEAERLKLVPGRIVGVGTETFNEPLTKGGKP